METETIKKVSVGTSADAAVIELMRENGSLYLLFSQHDVDFFLSNLIKVGRGVSTGAMVNFLISTDKKPTAATIKSYAAFT